MDRASYRRKSDPELHDALRTRFGEFYLIPEGGSAATALAGCAELVAEIDEPFDLVVCPVGTGGTLAGRASGLSTGQRAVDEVNRLHQEALGHQLDNWRIDHRYHCGGFARRIPELDTLIRRFHDQHGIALNWVYVAKRCWASVTPFPRMKLLPTAPWPS